MLKIPMYNVVPTNQEIGLGDVIRKVTDALHIHLEHCDCSVRQRWLNGKVVFTGQRTNIDRNKS